jgi:hypothetical protein
MLHMRDPQLQRVPDELSAKLQGLVHSTTTPGSDQLPSTTRDSDYAQRNQLQGLIRQMRSLPGLSEFMRGPAVEVLLSTPARSIVVVLVADETTCHALVLESSCDSLALVPLPGVTRKAIQDLRMIGLTLQKHGLASESHRDDRYMKDIQNVMLETNARLAKVWYAVAKPVIAHLGLSVSNFL